VIAWSRGGPSALASLDRPCSVTWRRASSTDAYLPWAWADCPCLPNCTIDYFGLPPWIDELIDII